MTFIVLRTNAVRFATAREEAGAAANLQENQ